MKTCFVRKKAVIINLETGERLKFNSISKAKRESRKLQMKLDNGLGRGSLKVVG